MAKEVPRQIANAQTIFNVANTVLFIWFTGALARLVQKMVPERKEVSLEIITPKFLSEGLLLGLKGLEEIERIADKVRSDLTPLGRSAHEQGFETTDTTRHILSTLYERVCHAARQATSAIVDVDQNKALEVVNMKAEIRGLVDEALEFQAEQVAPTTPDLIATFRLEDELVDANGDIHCDPSVLSEADPP